MAIPKLRFKTFNDSWMFLLGGEIFSSISDRKHNSDLPILAITQDQGAVPRELINYKITVTDKSVETYKVVQKGDFIISLRSFQGGIEYSNYKGICSPAYIILRNKIDIADLFYKFYLKTPNYIQILNSKLEGIRDGKMISYQYFSSFKLPYPSLPEQEKIADFLTSVDDKINLLKKKKELLEQYKKGVMQKIFSQELRFKDDEGKDFPEWEAKTLKDVTFKTDKKNKNRLHLSIYSVNNVEGFVPQSEQFEGLDSNERGYDVSMYKIVGKNTFAYNPARINVGSVGLYKGNSEVIISSLYVCFQTTENLYDEFLLKFLKSYNFNNQVLKIAEGGVRQYLFYENFSQIKIPLPSIDEQKKIANFLTALDDKIDLVEQQITQTELWKKGLLQQMFV